MNPNHIALLILLGLAGTFFCCSGSRVKGPPLPVVERVDLDRYLGTWFEIARYPNRFQKGCVKATADYRLRRDGDIAVLNSCREGDKDGPVKSAKGKAWVVDKKSNARLKVSFFWPFSGNYWIIDLGESYEYAVVGDPDRKYLWILSRRPQMDHETFSAISQKLVQVNYDPERLLIEDGALKPLEEKKEDAPSADPKPGS